MTHSPAAPPLRGYRFMQAAMGPLLKAARMSCRHFALLASLRLDRPLSPPERMRYLLHFTMCGVCRRLPGQFSALSELARRCPHEDGPDSPPPGEPGEPEALPPALDDDARRRISAQLRSASANGGSPPA